MENGQHGYGVTNNEIMDFLKENMVTRREFHEELGKCVTKEDAKQFVTKEDLLATKQELRGEIGKLRSNIIDHIDRKVADVKGDVVLLTRKEDTKVLAVVGKLEQKSVFTAEDAKEIQKMEPFPKLMVS